MGEHLARAGLARALVLKTGGTSQIGVLQVVFDLGSAAVLESTTESRHITPTNAYGQVDVELTGGKANRANYRVCPARALAKAGFDKAVGQGPCAWPRLGRAGKRRLAMGDRRGWGGLWALFLPVGCPDRLDALTRVDLTDAAELALADT